MRRVLTLFMVLLFSGTITFAQNRTVSGTVTDATGAPVEGATVRVKGNSRIGTAADVNGNFTISVPTGATLIVSGVGLTTREFAVGSQSTLNLSVARTGTQELSTVVVTALGIRRSEKAVGYAITKVDPNVVLQKSEPDLLKGLQGKVPGVDIRSSQGTPGSATRVQIRGNSSFGGETQPLFVVDGVPYSNTTLTTSNQESAGGAYGSGIGDLDPNDIETFNVLKGAAAAALYGSRASRGVIVITTKSGSGRKGPKPLNINLKSSVSFETISNLPEYQNSFGTGAEQRVGGGSNGSWGGRFGLGNVYNSSGDVIRKSASGIDSVPAWSPYLAAYPELFPGGLAAYQAYPNNVADLFKTGTVYENSLGVNGGDANSSLALTLSRVDHKGYVENSSYKRTNLSVGGQTRYKNWTFGANMAYTKSKQLGGFFGIAQSFTTQFGRSLIMGRSWPLPYLPPTDKAGRPLAFITGQYTNPLWGAYHNTITTYEDRTVLGFRMAYKVNNWINLSYNIGSNVTDTKRDEIIDINSPGVGGGLGQLTEDAFEQTELQSTFVATFNPKIGNNFTLDFKVGNDINDRRSRRQANRGSGFVVPNIYNLINSTTKTFLADSRNSRRIVGIFGDATIGYKNYVFVNVSGRNDFTSTLPFENSSYFYPGVSASFVFSDALGIKSNVFDYGKIRGGWAKVGNDANPNNGRDVFPLNTTTFLGQPFYSRGGTTIDLALTPEFTKEVELGLDLAFFKRRANLDFTWYDKRSTDLIFPIDVPVTTGFTTFNTNLGEISNKGVEIGISGTPIRNKNFSWDIRAAFTHNKNYVESLVAGLTRTSIGANGYNYIEPGMPYGYLRGSVAQRYEGQLLINPATGNLVAATDPAMIGNPNPDFKLGVTNTFTFKGFTLSALWDWTKGGDFFSETLTSLLGRGVTKDTEDRETGWVIPGVYSDPLNPQSPLLVGGKTVPNQTRISTNDLYFGTTFAINGINSYQTYDATVYRLRELTLGYEIPKTIVNKLKLGGIVFSVSGRNLWFYAPNVPRYTNFDPEANSLGSGIQQGVELSAAPTTKRIGVNLNITF